MNLVFQYLRGEAVADVVQWELNDDPVEMTSLAKEDTGEADSIHVSTRQGRHGPRVKWYPRLGLPDRSSPSRWKTLPA